MLARMKDLLRSKAFCVLATVADDAPHCSLMAYVADAPCQHLYMVTRKDTTKFRNLRQNPRVSLLVDTRDEPEEERRTLALTVAGRIEPVEGTTELRRFRSALQERHPGLGPILENTEAAVLCVRIESLLLLDGPNEAHFEEL